MANVKKKFNDGSDQRTNDWEITINLLQENLAKFDQKVSRMDSRIQTLSEENEVLRSTKLDQEVSRMDGRIQTLSDENEVLRSELKQVQENHARIIEGEEDIVREHFIYENLRNNEENLVANDNDTKLSILKPASFVAFFQRQTNVRDDDSIYNTGTVHMHAIAATAACISKPNPTKSWCFAWGSILLICCQIAVLRWLILESSYESCVTHTDCGTGEFCGINTMKWLDHRCTDCEFSLAYWNDKNDNISTVTEDFCSGFMEKEPSFDEMDQSVVWFANDKVYYNDKFNITDQEHIACYANAYCKDNEVAERDTFDKICDHLRLRRSRLSIDQLLMFILVSLLFTSTLCADIEEAAIEEKILKFSMELVGDGQSIPRSTYLLAYSLRVRRYMLPWLYASATVSIMIKEEYSASNILLNLLTIGFVTEADDMLATLIFPKREVKLVDEFVAMAKGRGVQSVSFFWTRVLGLSASILIVLVTFEVERLERIFDDDAGLCSDIHNTLGLIFSVYVPLFYIFIQGIGQTLLSDDKYIHKLKRVPHAIMEISTNLVAFCMTNLVIYITAFAVYTTRGMWKQRSLELSVEWAVVTLISAFCFICLSIYTSCYIDRLKAR